MGLDGIRIELYAQSFLSHGDDELPVGAQASPFGRLQVDANEQVIVATAERTRQVGVLRGVEELGLVYMAAQSVGDAVVAQCAHGAVEHERVVVELHQVLPLRQLQDVNAPGDQSKLGLTMRLRGY